MTSPNDDSRVAGRLSEPTIPSEFSLCRGGPLYRLACRLGFQRDSKGLRRFGLAIALLTWVPLAALSGIEGVFHQGATVSFWQSVGTHVRLLLTIPLFFLAESLFDPRAADVLHRILEVRLVLPRDQPALAATARGAIRACDSRVLEAVLMLVTLVLIGAGMRVDLPLAVSTWRANAGGGFTLAGWWYNLVSIPVFQFLFWRWCWRLLIWSRLLWRLARLELQLIPTHPDRAGGLAVLGVAHVDLAPLALGATAVLSSSYAEQILFTGAAPQSFAVPIVAAVIGSTLALIAPLVFFTPKLIDAKQLALLEYGTLAATYTRAFAAKWLPTNPPPPEPILGTPDLQSLADLGSSFDLIRNMTVLPIARFQVLLIAGAAALPFVALGLLIVPLDQLITDSLKAFLNI